MPSAKTKRARAAARLAAATKLNKAQYLEQSGEARGYIKRMPSFRSGSDQAIRSLRGSLARSGITGGQALMMEQQTLQDQANQAANYNMAQGQALASLANQDFSVKQGADTQVEGMWMNYFDNLKNENDARKQAQAESLQNLIGAGVGLATDIGLGIATGGASVPASLMKYAGGTKTGSKLMGNFVQGPPTASGTFNSRPFYQR